MHRWLDPPIALSKSHCLGNQEETELRHSYPYALYASCPLAWAASGAVQWRTVNHGPEDLPIGFSRRLSIGDWLHPITYFVGERRWGEGGTCLIPAGHWLVQARGRSVNSLAVDMATLFKTTVALWQDNEITVLSPELECEVADFRWNGSSMPLISSCFLRTRSAATWVLQKWSG